MTPHLVRLALAAMTATLAACGTMNPHKKETPPEQQPLGPNRYLQDDSTPQQSSTSSPDAATQTPATSDATPSQPPEKTSADAPGSGATPPVPPPPTSQYPYGKPVPGKKGFVNSPYDDKAGMIDVRDYAPGTKVRDPYTNKIFLVP